MELAEGTGPQCEKLLFCEILHNFTLKVAWNIVDLVHIARIILVKVASYCEHINANLISLNFGELWKYQLDKVSVP
jgi:hypothetical protein